MRTNVTYKNLRDGNAVVLLDGKEVGDIVRDRSGDRFLYVDRGSGEPHAPLFTTKQHAVAHARDWLTSIKRQELVMDLIEWMDSRDPLADFIVSQMERIDKLEDELSALRREIGRVESNGGWSQGLPG